MPGLGDTKLFGRANYCWFPAVTVLCRCMRSTRRFFRRREIAHRDRKAR